MFTQTHGVFFLAKVLDIFARQALPGLTLLSDIVQAGITNTCGTDWFCSQFWLQLVFEDCTCQFVKKLSEICWICGCDHLSNSAIAYIWRSKTMDICESGFWKWWTRLFFNSVLRIILWRSALSWTLCSINSGREIQRSFSRIVFQHCAQSIVKSIQIVLKRSQNK